MRSHSDHNDHEVLPGPRGVDDKYASEESAEYSGDMCTRIARSVRRAAPAVATQATAAAVAVDDAALGDPLAHWATLYEAEWEAPPLA